MASYEYDFDSMDHREDTAALRQHAGAGEVVDKLKRLKEERDIEGFHVESQWMRDMLRMAYCTVANEGDYGVYPRSALLYTIATGHVLSPNSGGAAAVNIIQDIIEGVFVKRFWRRMARETTLSEEQVLTIQKVIASAFTEYAWNAAPDWVNAIGVKHGESGW